MRSCDCEHLHEFDQPQVADLGVDTRNGRFGQATVHQCTRCGARWLHYLVEYEAFSRSGRWFCGRLADDPASTATAETAIATLAAMPWYWAGGTYFDGEVRKNFGPVPVDLYGPPALE